MIKRDASSVVNISLYWEKNCLCMLYLLQIVVCVCVHVIKIHEYVRFMHVIGGVVIRKQSMYTMRREYTLYMRSLYGVFLKNPEGIPARIPFTKSLYVNL